MEFYFQESWNLTTRILRTGAVAAPARWFNVLINQDNGGIFLFNLRSCVAQNKNERLSLAARESLEWLANKMASLKPEGIL
jgi:hypothetical protein